MYSIVYDYTDKIICMLEKQLDMELDYLTDNIASILMALCTIINDIQCRESYKDGIHDGLQVFKEKLDRQVEILCEEVGLKQ